MNKHDAASIRKEFKPDNTKLKLGDVVSIYVKWEHKQIIGIEKEQFSLMDTQKQELYLKNFKKILTGQLDSKLFDLEFSDNKLGQNPTQGALIDTLESGNFMEQVEEIAHKIYNVPID
jgi:Fe-S cluster biosynthesis and repair protein YggX